MTKTGIMTARDTVIETMIMTGAMATTHARDTDLE
jgi:hypothetical protein